MRIAKSTVLIFFVLFIWQKDCFAQISGNAIGYYYNGLSGSCGASTFTPGDSIIGSTPSTGLAGGPGAYTYQWTQSIDQGSTYTNIPGATKPSYFTGTINQTTYYVRQVSSGAATSASTIVVFYVSAGKIAGNKISITLGKATSQSYPCGTPTASPGDLSGPVPTGTSSNNYQYSWALSTDNGATYSRAGGASSTSADYIPATITKSTWYVRVVVSGVCIDTSAPIKFVFGGVSNNYITAPAVSSACASTGFNPGTIAGSALPVSYTYQWQSGPDSTHFTDIAAVTTQSYSPGVLTTTTAYRRKCITGTCTAFTNAVQISVAAAFSANTITAAQLIDSATAPTQLNGSAVSAGASSVKYNWVQSTDSVTFTTAGGSSSMMNYQPGPLNQKTFFRRIASSGTCSVNSNIVVITTKKCDTCIKKPPVPVVKGCPNNPVVADMGVHLTRRPGNKGTGVTFDYTLSANNFGTATGTKIILKDTITANVNEIGISAVDQGIATFDATTHILTWDIGIMKPSSIATMILTVQPLDNNQIISKVSIHAFECDPDLSNNALRDTINDPLPPPFAGNLPDIITPNGDGKNDKFIIKNITLKVNSNNELVIFDRWGNTVFTEVGYQNNWDGNGLSPGTYFYVLKINTGGKQQLIKGYITLMR